MSFNSVGVFRGTRIEPVTSADRVGVLHVFPGSFNPLHDGHRWMYESIDEEETGILGRSYGKNEYAIVATTSAKYFEISTKRVGKEDLGQEELMTRLRQFRGYASVLVTHAALFAEKYESLKDMAERVIFHIGYDTYERLVGMHDQKTLASYNFLFCVWPRGNKEFQSGPKNFYSSGLTPPPHLATISSTQIRSRTRGS